jgi:hypothetical protein
MVSILLVHNLLFAKLTISQVALQCLQWARSISLIQINAYYQVNMLELENINRHSHTKLSKLVTTTLMNFNCNSWHKLFKYTLDIFSHLHYPHTHTHFE